VTATHRSAALLGLAVLLGCGRPSPAPLAPLPETPEAVVSAFMDAVNAADLERMAGLWGDQRGPSNVSNRIRPEERHQRLMIIQQVLRCDQYRILGVAPSGGEQVVTAELTMGERRVTVPFKVVQPRRGTGWLVREPGIAAAMPAAGRRQTP
jgi:hypothetical protein